VGVAARLTLIAPKPLAARFARKSSCRRRSKALKAIRMAIGKIIARICRGRQIDAHDRRMTAARGKRD